MKFFSLIYQGDVHPSKDEKVIPKESFTTLLEATALLEKVKEDASALRKKTEEDCARLKKQAKQQGFNEGLEKFNEEIIKLDLQLKTLHHEMQKMVLPLALKAAKKIVAKELEQFPETIVDIVLQALAPIKQGKKIVIYVSKQDKEVLEAEKPKLRAILEQVELLSIQERADVSPGGCIIQTESGLINATIENQWKALERAFEKYLKSIA